MKEITLRHFIASLALSMALAAVPGFAQAQDPHTVQPERPTVATHAGTVAPGWLEIEGGTEFDRFADHSHGGSAPIVFKLGLAPRLQLTAQTPIVHPAGVPSTGFGDTSIGVKWRALEGAPLLGDFALLPAIKAPTGATDSSMGTGTTDFSLLLISSHQFGPVAMDLNTGYVRRTGDGSAAPRNAELWTAALGGPAHKALGWAAEIYGYPGTHGPAGSNPIVAFLGGPTLQVRNSIALDSGLIAPIKGGQPRAFYAGVVYNVGRVWK